MSQVNWVVQLDHIPARRPHLHLEGNELYFLISKRPFAELDELEESIWAAIDGKATVADLKLIDTRSVEVLKRFHEREMIEFLPSKPPRGRKRVLIVEPHMDDAILSVGGLMWKKRNEWEIHVVSVTGVSNFTSYHRIDRDYFDVKKVTQLRREESDLVMAVVGGTHEVLDRKDAPLRYQDGEWSLDWFKKNRRSISAYVNHSVSDREVNEWKDVLLECLKGREYDELWIPLGIGTSADHEMTRNACLWALQEDAGLASGRDVCFYHEVPYSSNFPWHIDELCETLGGLGAKLEKLDYDISDSLAIKQRLISIYASQFKMSYMAPKVEASARLFGGQSGRFVESLLRIESMPSKHEQIELYSNKSDIEKLDRKIGKCFSGMGSRKTITLICPMGFGCWGKDIEIILTAFPDSLLKIYLSDDALDETTRRVFDRVTVVPVESSPKGWLKKLLKLAFIRHRSMVVFTGNQFKKYQLLIRVLFWLSNPLIVNKPDTLARSLDRRLVGKDRHTNC